MGLIDKIKKGLGNDNYEETYDDYYNEFDGYNDPADQNAPAGAQNQPSYDQAAPAQNAPAYQPYQSTSSISLSGSAIEMKVVKPEHFDSASQIADHLLNNRTVVLNLENTNKETARRLIDFLSGVAYSIDGSLKKIASNAYVITPNNVDVGEARLSSSDDNAQHTEATETAADDEFGTF